jgi:hypothetical protein
LDNYEVEIDCGGPNCEVCSAPCSHPANTFSWYASSDNSITADVVSCSGNVVSVSSNSGYNIVFTFGEVPQAGTFYQTDDYTNPDQDHVNVFLDGPIGPNYLSMNNTDWVYVTNENGVLTFTLCNLAMKQESNSFQGLLNGTIVCN